MARNVSGDLLPARRPILEFVYRRCDRKKPQIQNNALD
jgi:hypothetical protein